MTINQTEQLKKLLRENNDVFDFHGNEGFTQTIEHKIKLTEPGPINCFPRRHNVGMIDEINKTVEEHVKKGHIIPSTSPWAFGIVPVKTENQTVVLGFVVTFGH